MATDANHRYIIGVILILRLCPLLIPRAGHPGNYDIVKIRIDGAIANVTEPIPENDPIVDTFFRMKTEGNIIPAYVIE